MSHTRILMLRSFNFIPVIYLDKPVYFLMVYRRSHHIVILNLSMVFVEVHR